MVRGIDLCDWDRMLCCRMNGRASLTQAAPMVRVWQGTVTFRSTVETSINRVINCGPQNKFDDCDVSAMVRYVSKNRGTTVKLSGRTAHRQLYKEGFYRMAAEYKISIWWLKILLRWSTEMRGKVMSSFIMSSTSGWVNAWPKDLYLPEFWTAMVRRSSGTETGTLNLNDPLYSMVKHFFPNGMVSSHDKVSIFIEQQKLMRIKMKTHAVTFTVRRFQPNWTTGGDIGHQCGTLASHLTTI